MNTDSHFSSSPSLKSLPVFFSSNCKPLSNYVISSWLDDVSGKHITITTLRKSITELAFSTDALTEEQAWSVAMLGDHTHKTVQQHYLKDHYTKSKTSDLLADVLSGDVMEESEGEHVSGLESCGKRRYCEEEEEMKEFERVFMRRNEYYEEEEEEETAFEITREEMRREAEMRRKEEKNQKRGN
ncbi:hypothetical protein ADUPG1_008107 [Aduncisulcus paluster]|uniref:Uncharacterized protein n=1 Tax=Aduncisulcus paluster TaxID=2918883 RepID=A0ABQ5KUX3_9EUKA|nr:hypothetical protein ADUPG1_008107 [Aduncisulcus paluster]